MSKYRKASPISTEFFTNRCKIKAVVISSQFLRLLKVEKCIKGTNFPDKDFLFDRLYAVCDNRTSKDTLFLRQICCLFIIFFLLCAFSLEIRRDIHTRADLCQAN